MDEKDTAPAPDSAKIKAYINNEIERLASNGSLDELARFIRDNLESHDIVRRRIKIAAEAASEGRLFIIRGVKFDYSDQAGVLAAELCSDKGWTIGQRKHTGQPMAFKPRKPRPPRFDDSRVGVVSAAEQVPFTSSDVLRRTLANDLAAFAEKNEDALFDGQPDPDLGFAYGDFDPSASVSRTEDPQVCTRTFASKMFMMLAVEEGREKVCSWLSHAVERLAERGSYGMAELEEDGGKTIVYGPTYAKVMINDIRLVRSALDRKKEQLPRATLDDAAAEARAGVQRSNAPGKDAPAR